MERTEEFASGDINSSNGNSLEQKEASAAVFEDGQVRDTVASVRPMKGGEEFVYGDSRPDETRSSDTFEDVSDSPMMTTTREDLPEVHRADPEEMRAASHGQDDEIRPQYDRRDDSEGQVVAKRGNA